MLDTLTQIPANTDLQTHILRTTTPFTSFLHQDSGCLSYGVHLQGQPLFIKLATTPKAKASLQRAEALHRNVAHSALVPFHGTLRATTGDIALVYDWLNAEVLYDYVAFPGHDGRRNPNSAHARFRALPAHTILHALNTIYDLHLTLAAKGFIAVDFYDGCILYDFTHHRTFVCDLDEYRPAPFILHDSRLPGSKRFMAPEEFTPGATIDQTTNVFALGRAALELLSDGTYNAQSWRASPEVLDVIRRATNPNRSKRFPSVAAFVQCWHQALANADEIFI